MMFAPQEMNRIVRDGRLDNNQVVCLADALVGYVDEAFARAFVNKRLDDADVRSDLAFPKLFSREKFLVVNQLWRKQSWTAHHRLVDVQEHSASPQESRTPASTLHDDEVVKQVREELAKVKDERDQAKSAQTRAEADLMRVQTSLAQSEANLVRVQKALEQSGSDLVCARKIQAQAESERDLAQEARTQAENELAHIREMQKQTSEAQGRAETDLNQLKADLISARAKVEMKAAEISALCAAKNAVEVEFDHMKEECEAVKAELSLANEKVKKCQNAKTGEVRVRPVFVEGVQAVWEKLSQLLGVTTASESGSPDGGRLVNLYLTLISSVTFEDSRFETWFNFFDGELYRLLRTNPIQLRNVRTAIENDLNGRLRNRRISWNLVGAAYDDQRFQSDDQFGTVVHEVIWALQTKCDGTVIRRAKVRTDTR